MTETPSGEPFESDADRGFADFVEQLVEQLQARRSTPLGEWAREHPEYVERLRRLLPDLVAAVELNGEAGGAAETANGIPEDGALGLQKTLGDFRIVRQIGRGGMGIVYEAEQISLQRRVALKVLPFATLLDPRQLQRFKNESLIEAQLSHPNIVSVLSVGQASHVHYFAMPLIEGISAAEWIAHCRQQLESIHASDWDPESRSGSSGRSNSASVRARVCQAADIARQVACALEYAHQNGILHRDVKPSNILIDNQRKAYLTDFGLAHARDTQLTMTGDVMGTLRYMSPEQALGRRAEVGERSDIYSLGAALYEMVTLRPMFADEDTESLLSVIADRQPPNVRTIDSQIPCDLETIILKATAKENNERYESAQAMADDLQCFLEDRSILARRPRLVDRMAKWSRRHRKLVYGAASVMLLMTAILAVSTVVVLRGSQRTQDALGRVAELLYVSEMQLAYQAWNKHWTGEAAAILARHVPGVGPADLRGVEWHLLDRLVKEPPPLVMKSHEGVVHELAVFPDGKKIATVGDDGLVRIWRSADGHLLSTIETGDTTLAAVAISPCGTMLATGENTVALWSVDRGQKIRDLTTHDTTVESIVFSPDGSLLVSASRYEDLRVCTIEGKLQWQVTTGSRNESVCFSPDGRRLYVPVRHPENVLHDRICVFELKTDATRASEPGLAAPALLEQRVVQRPAHLTFVARRREMIAFGSRYNGKISLLSERDESWSRELPPQRDHLNAIAISPQERTLASAHNDGSIVCWPISRIDEYGHDWRLRAHQGAVTYLQFIDDRRLASCGADGTVRIWKLGPSERALSVAADDVKSAIDLAFSADGRHLAILNDAGFLWHGDADGSQGQTWRYEGPDPMDLDDVEYSPRGDLLALSSEESNRILLWDVKLRTVRTSLYHEQRSVHDVCFSPDGESLVSIGDDGFAHLWNLANRREAERLSLPHHGWTVAYSSDGKQLATGGRFAEILIWDLSRCEVVLRLPATSNTRDLAFQPDGRLLASAHSDGHLRLWDLGSGELIADLQSHEDVINQLAFSSDGATIGSIGDDGTVRLWSARLHCPFGIVERRPANGMTIAFAPGDQSLVAGWGIGNYDSRPAVLLWRIKPSSETPVHADGN